MTNESLNRLKFLLEDRSVGLDFHLRQVKRWFDFDDGKKLDNVLVYASVELRCAIERLAFELMYIVQEKKLTSQEEKRCKNVNGTLELLQEVEPDYRKLAQFTNLVASLHPRIPRIALIDIKFLIRSWHELSNYCHLHLRPSEAWESTHRSFQTKAFRFLKECFDKITSWVTRPSALGIVSKQSMEPEVKDIYEKFLLGEIDEEQVKVRLRIAGPVLESRMRMKG